MFEFASPWVLLFLPLPFLIKRFLPHVSFRPSTALKIPFYQAMLTILTENKGRDGAQKQTWLLFLVSCLLLLAAAGPRWVGEPQPQITEGRNIMLALDLSGSMALNDMFIQGHQVTRLAVVEHAAEQFVLQRIGDRIGLILFGSRAYLQTPLTYDHHSVLLRLEDATVGLAGQTTSIGDALGLAVKRLQEVSPKGRVIILLTDGANNSGVLAPLKAAELAQLEHIKVYTIGLGASLDPQMLGGFFANRNVSADLDESTLEKIAQITQGRYFRATDSASLQAIYETINHLETVSQKQANIRPQKEYYPWPLALATLLLLYWFAERIGLIFGLREFLSLNGRRI